LPFPITPSSPFPLPLQPFISNSPSPSCAIPLPLHPFIFPYPQLS